ncbi:outer membrane protein assembly factor BamB [Ramlibacter sp. USB13]|uniref:Outer membrane protein assembly factor BamB n=1 Tax=Ramlibacter cellulosilyticus TaxID=2764187 RepID=A0A923SF68_9BURK|nr:outer membrane protein assembly factor BamB [Ramlibacter cellulosilyticus]MBC5783642.1 outer membrane protein assembly factor BamB [Ramlibacter cellulosilyticus]
MSRAATMMFRTLAVASLVSLSACSMMPTGWFGSSEKPKPAELQPDPKLLGVRQAWTGRVAAVDFPLVVGVSGNAVAVAAGDGTVAGFDATTGREQWRGTAGAPIAAGIGFDGSTAAVVTRNNDLVAFVSGKEAWRQKLPALSYTPPLVAGARVFVLSGDRSVSAFDGGTGRRLWSQQRTGEPLVLRQAGVMLPVGDTLVVGQGGRLVGLNPLNGSVRWESTIAAARGINDIERLVDLVGHASRVGDSVCARAFQAAVGCVDTAGGRTTWTQRANGGEGLGGDGASVFGTENDGRVVAWKRENGQRAWTNERLLHRGLGTPLALGRSVVVGDSFGFVHLLSREDGTLLTRLATDGSAIAAAPVAASNSLVVVTRNGGVFAFAPQ